MKIPVFVSAPTDLNEAQEKSRKIIVEQLNIQQFEPRALGRSDYPSELPLREVLSIAKHCVGGIILGFSQFEANTGVWKKGTCKERLQTDSIVFPTPWNQLEAGILFGLGLPLLIFREEDITGGVFDPGVTDVYIHSMPKSGMSDDSRDALSQVFLKWGANVRQLYYSL